jgi:hypothetical protein
MDTHLDLFVILDEVDKFCLSDDVKHLHDKIFPMQQDIIVNVTGKHITIPIDDFTFVHENSVIYVPKNYHSFFANETIVVVNLVDLDELDEIHQIEVQPISQDFYRDFDITKLQQIFSDSKFISKNYVISNKNIPFKISKLMTQEGKSVDIGTTKNIHVKIVVSEPTFMKHTLIEQHASDDEMQVVPNKHIDISPFRTEEYSRPYVSSCGVVVYKKNTDLEVSKQWHSSKSTVVTTTERAQSVRKDFSPIKTGEYTKMYIMEGKIVYTK